MTTMSVVGECFFWYRLTRVVPDNFHRAVKRLCVCVCREGRETSTHVHLYVQVRARNAGMSGAPLQLRSCWKFREHQADFRLDYTYNGLAMFDPRPLTNVVIHVPVHGDVKKMQCKPPGEW